MWRRAAKPRTECRGLRAPHWNGAKLFYNLIGLLLRVSIGWESHAANDDNDEWRQYRKPGRANRFHSPSGIRHENDRNSRRKRHVGMPLFHDEWNRARHVDASTSPIGAGERARHRRERRKSAHSESNSQRSRLLSMHRIRARRRAHTIQSQASHSRYTIVRSARAQNMWNQLENACPFPAHYPVYYLHSARVVPCWRESF